MTEQDVHNYSSSPLHRLPTYSASQALEKLSTLPQKPIISGLRAFDLLLQGKRSEAEKDDVEGGFSRGEATEVDNPHHESSKTLLIRAQVYGPPGIGKTTLALQLVARELQEQRSVVWVDTASRFTASRLKDVIATTKATASQSSEKPTEWKRLHHFQCPTLPHLLALLAHPSDSFPNDLSLLIIDNLSTLFNLAYPRRYESNSSNNTENTAAHPHKKSDSAQWASGRRWAVLSDLVSRLNRLAVTSNIAIVILNQTTTRVRQGGGAHIYPSISGSIWENGIANRAVLYRDWTTQPNGAHPRHTGSVRFAGVLKAKGVGYEGTGMVALFKITKDGLKEVETSSDGKIPTPLTKLKRKWDEIADDNQSGAEVEDNVEGSDAEEDEYGWQKEDETAQADDLLGTLP